MGSHETLPAVNNPFAGSISQIDAVSIDDVVGEARLGPQLSFTGARSPLESIKDFVDQLRFLDGTGIPARMVAKGNAAFQQVLSAIQQMRSYDVRNGGNEGLRNSLVQTLVGNYENLVEATLPAILYATIRSSGIKTAEANRNALLADMERQRTELVGFVNESKELLAGQKKFSEEIAIAGYGNLFAKEAKQHGNAAKIWLSVTGVCAGLTALAGWLNYQASVNLLTQFSKMPSSQVQSVPTSLTLQFTVAKVILFTIGLSAAYWAARVYRSHRHNCIVNKHRANALTSFEQFVTSTKDEEVKNAVLLKTTACIYAPQSTGFSSGNDADGDSSLKILEIIRNFQK